MLAVIEVVIHSHSRISQDAQWKRIGAMMSQIRFGLHGNLVNSIMIEHFVLLPSECGLAGSACF